MNEYDSPTVKCNLETSTTTQIIDMDFTIRQASDADSEIVTKLLTDNCLPTADLKESSVHLFVGLINDLIVASIGIEIYKTNGLLRSLAVDKNYRDRGIGDKLVSRLFDYCKTSKVEDLYLLTTTAYKYFGKYGFFKADREKVPESIRKTQEFRSICPVSAVVMMKKVSNSAESVV